MTPEDVNAESVQRRLVAITDRVAELEDLGEVSPERLSGDWVVRAATERVLTQLVELAAQANMHLARSAGTVPPDEYRLSFAAVAELGIITRELADRIALSAGLRNILVHQYLDVDLEIVAASVAKCVRDYTEYRRQVAQWLERGSA